MDARIIVTLTAISIMSTLSNLTCYEVFPAYPLKINKEDSLFIPTECCDVKLKTSKVSAGLKSTVVSIGHYLNGKNLAINPSVFLARVYDSNMTAQIKNVWFVDENYNRIRRLRTGAKDSLFSVNISLAYSEFKQPTKLVIYPSNYITCNGKRIVQDSLTIEVR